VLLAAFFVVAGIMHFIVPEAYVRIVASGFASAAFVSGAERDRGDPWRRRLASLLYAARCCLGSGSAARSRLSRQYLHCRFPCAVSRNLWEKLGAMASFTTPNPLDSVDSAFRQTIERGTCLERKDK
jgi:hypothetical protein